MHVRNVIVYREPGRFAGWPANYGIWSWGDEIVVGFTLGYHRAGLGFHTIDREKPSINVQARSLNGGESWEVERMPGRTPGGRGISADEHMREDLRVGKVLDEGDVLMDPPGGIDFTHPDFALMCARTGLRAGARSWFYISYDRCRSWQGPYKLPMFGTPGVAARTDYQVLSRNECLLLLTAAKPNGDEGWSFCAKTDDGGKTFSFLSWIGPEPAGYSIMPSSVRLSESRILVAVRCKEEGKYWIDLYISDDNGRTWRYMNRPVENTGRGGNPPSMIKLQDGRLCLTYGYRGVPYGIRAKLSEDDGKTWGEEIILRDDGGNYDLGYPRTVQRSDGKIVTLYYFNDHPEGERYIAATIWEP
ncbi:exo-alpha-sialidase [Candidatus Poribacteria bacterium]|nr:exo-alpha-sialidase [Candidatus Poribacteria bacterium]